MMMNKSVLEVTRHLPRLTLQEMALFRIMTTICNNRQLLPLIVECNFQRGLQYRICTRKGPEWEAVQAKANELVSQICMPDSFKDNILELLWPVSNRILLWKSIYAPWLSNTCLQRFFWTDRGRVDNAKTVQCLVGNKNISVRERFVLACSVCASEEMNEVWRELSNEDKAYFYEPRHERLFPLLRFWTHRLGGSDLEVETIQKYLQAAIETAVDIGLLQAVKSLFAISTESEMIINVERCLLTNLLFKLMVRNFLEEDENDIGYFLYSEMSDDLQLAAFNDHPTLVLSFLLHSSEYPLCLTYLEERLHYIAKDDISVLIHLIFSTYYLDVDKNDNCGKLFTDFWRMIPTSFKGSSKARYAGVFFLSLLIRDYFPFLLQEDAFEKIEELTSPDSTRAQELGFHQEKWKLLLFLIEEEIVTITILKSCKRTLYAILSPRQRNKNVYNKIKGFVHKVGNEKYQRN